MIRVRLARPDEAEELTAIAHAAKRHWGYPETWINLWRKDLTVLPAYIQENTVYVAKAGASKGGFVGIEEEAGEAQMGHLWVHPSQMGQQIGKLLVECALSYCKASGITSLVAASDPNAADFYRRLGATDCGTVDSVPAPRKLPLFRFEVNDIDLQASATEEEKCD